MGGEPINLHPTGCHSVNGLGSVRTTALSTGFYWLFGVQWDSKTLAWRQSKARSVRHLENA